MINREEYYPFGETSYGSYGKKRYRFCGKEKDEESGLYYYGMRYYSPWTCRFMSVDPLAPKYPFYTPYQYAGNKPINNLDLDGLEDVPAPATGGSGGQNATGTWVDTDTGTQTTIGKNENISAQAMRGLNWVPLSEWKMMHNVKAMQENLDRMADEHKETHKGDMAVETKANAGINNFNNQRATEKYQAQEERNKVEQRQIENQTSLSADNRTPYEKEQGRVGIRRLELQIAQEKHKAWVEGQPSHSFNEALLTGYEWGSLAAGSIGLARNGLRLYGAWKAGNLFFKGEGWGVKFIGENGFGTSTGLNVFNTNSVTICQTLETNAEMKTLKTLRKSIEHSGFNYNLASGDQMQIFPYNGTNYLVNGHHRFAVANKLGISKISASVIDESYLMSRYGVTPQGLVNAARTAATKGNKLRWY